MLCIFRWDVEDAVPYKWMIHYDKHPGTDGSGVFSTIILHYAFRILHFSHSSTPKNFFASTPTTKDRTATLTLMSAISAKRRLKG